MQERSEKHSANLQQQMVETASKLQAAIPNEMSQSNLFKKLLGQPEKKE